jgi:hypothetical protein
MKKTVVTVLTALGCAILLVATTAFTGSADFKAADKVSLATPLVNLVVDQNGLLNQTDNQTSDSLADVQIYSGLISGVTSDQLTLTLGDGSVVDIKLGENTQTNVPSLGVNATVNGLLVNQPANVAVHVDSNQSIVADDVQVNPAAVSADVNLKTFSLVTAYQPGVSITVKDNNGLSTLFQLTNNTNISPTSAELKVGSYVQIVTLHDMVCGPLTAGEIVVWNGTIPETTTPAPTGSNGTSGNSGSPQSPAANSDLLKLNIDVLPTESTLLKIDADTAQYSVDSKTSTNILDALLNLFSVDR